MDSLGVDTELVLRHPDDQRLPESALSTKVDNENTKPHNEVSPKHCHHGGTTSILFLKERRERQNIYWSHFRQKMGAIHPIKWRPYRAVGGTWRAVPIAIPIPIAVERAVPIAGKFCTWLQSPIQGGLFTLLERGCGFLAISLPVLTGLGRLLSITIGCWQEPGSP